MSRLQKIRHFRSRYEAWYGDRFTEPRYFRTKCALLRWARGRGRVMVRTMRPCTIHGRLYDVSSYMRLERGIVVRRSHESYEGIQ